MKVTEVCTVLYGNPSQSYRASPAIRNLPPHTALHNFSQIVPYWVGLGGWWKGRLVDGASADVCSAVSKKIQYRSLQEICLSATDIGSHSVACHLTQVNMNHLNSSQTGRCSIYLLRRDRRWFTCPQTVTHPNSNHLIVTWSQLWIVILTCYMRYATKPFEMMCQRCVGVCG